MARSRHPFAQLVTERLGIPIDNVAIVHGDTDKVQFGMGTYGSRSGAVGISAISKALDKIEAKAKKVAAHLMEAAEGDIEFKDGSFTVAGTDKTAAWGEVALAAYVAHKFLASRVEPGLKETRSTTRGISPSRRAATSAKSRSIRPPARASSWPGRRSTTSAP